MTVLPIRLHAWQQVDARDTFQAHGQLRYRRRIVGTSDVPMLVERKALNRVTVERRV
jgi:hypothetical protein